MNKVFHFLSIFIIVLVIISAGFGLFYKSGGQSFDFLNLYRDTVKIYGEKKKKNDSYFFANTFKGTDFMTWFVALPLMILALMMDIKNNTIKSILFLTAMIAYFLYYSVSYSMGVTYNVLHLVYLALFSCTLYASILGYGFLKTYSIKISAKIYTNGLKIFLVFCGISLFVAWLPDIIESLINKKSLGLIEIYTTQVTYVLDMAIISPLIFICLCNLRKNNNIGYILLGIILNMLSLVGLMVILQTVFQNRAGIEMPVEAAITKVGIFVLLAIVAIYHEVKLVKNIENSGNGIQPER
jgi:hypothetical protein